MDNVGLVNGERWYTQGELLAAVEEHDHQLSQGLLEKWVGYGLLDQGTRRGRGQGRGALFVWPENQLQLLLVLLEKRATVSRTRVLANLPVAIWLYWGEDFVPLRQVRRAMETWAEVGRPRPRRDWDAMARRIVQGIADRSSTKAQRQAAADVIAHVAEERLTDVDALEAVLRPIVGGRNAAAFTDAPRVAELLIGQINALARIQELPDAIFTWARAVILSTLGDYLREQPRLAQDPRFGSMHPSQTFEDFAVSSCRTLASILGMYLLRPSAPGLPAPLNPALWESGRARLSASATYQPSPLTLPPWIDGGAIRVDVHIEVDTDTT